ncbi:HlyD family efflux transporter periplasmic adaptor subunit [Christensenella intestinihominis]|uniref:HlyD family efflux transporter periplasmic adaptor subunit n=1 Tax=Christensenella intestinihominis TaxID=1851429 RepID=UPI000829B092|nr:HlyD family efflux transporter periplasmic adaptor subunit [Christensenella intestinihominis]
MALKRRRRANPKFYLFIGAIAVVAVVVLFFIFNIQTVEVEQGTIPFEAEAAAVVVRDEQVVSAQNYGKANYIASEGERVEAEAPVMEVYKWGYNEKVMNDLIDYQTKIEQYQENGFQSEDLANLQNQITAKAAELRGIINGTAEGDVVTAERELKSLMANLQNYLKENVTPDQQLQDFYTQEAEIAGRVDNWRQQLTAPAAGVVSYYFDGAEDALNAANIENIKSSDIIDILNGTTSGQEPVDEEAEQPVYRLVNSYKWYLVIRSEEEIPEFTNDREFSVAFNDYVARQYQGIVSGTVKEENDYLYIIEISDDIGELLNVRRTDARVFTQFTGLKIPEKALKEKDGVTGVNVVVGREKTFVPVTVDIIKDGNAIVTPLEADSPLAERQHVEV